MTFLRATIAAASLLAATTALRGEPFTVYRDGESFTYEVSWAIIWGAGRITIAAHDGMLEHTPVVRVTVHTASRGLVRLFYRYDDRAEVVVNRRNGQIILAQDKTSGGRSPSDTHTTFDYATRTVTYVNRARPGRNRVFKLPPGEPIDLISCLINTRSWDVKPGDKRNALVYFDNDVYPVTITAEDYETVTTSLGTFRTLRLVPEMTHNPKGIFARQGHIQVWVSQKPPRLPVKMQLQLRLGTATLTLIKHDPGKPPPPLPATQSAAAK